MNELFYPKKKRRTAYSKTKRGKYYSNYSYYRQEIREDSLFRCVYCDIHELENGGEEHMNLDHFRPKAIDKFSSLVNDPNNLVWACGGCNNLKSDFWPITDSDFCFVGKEGFLDPFVDSYQEYFLITDDGTLVAEKDPAQYMIMILALNRESRKKFRELRLLKRRLVDEFSRKIDEMKAWKCDLEASDALSNAQKDQQIEKISEMQSWLETSLTLIKKLLIDNR
jgi:hypothetical protein